MLTFNHNLESQKCSVTLQWDGTDTSNRYYVLNKVCRGTRQPYSGSVKEEVHFISLKYFFFPVFDEARSLHVALSLESTTTSSI